ncbi:glycosyltransferase family 9 protein [Geomonas sp. Red421]|uniref:Glycosyltransferase family 9 protein n=1 Tax=Geomonas anaerohicana TaxID=2798583 RepID=A0ABS0YGN7_9BACT|nr:glycosyltransferase family 9 protein [Geomonas anaerohicana]
MLARNFLLDGLASVLPRPSAAPGEKQAVMVVRLDVIGDFVLWLDAAAALRQRYPAERYRLVLVGNALWTDLAAQQPFFDQVVPVNLGRLLRDPGYRFELWRRLRALRCEVALNPTFSRHFPCDDAVMRVCGARERIGFAGDFANQRPWEMAISNRWYTRLIPAAQGQLMELERNAEFVRGLGVASFRPGLPELVVAEELPAALAGERYYVVVPGAGKALRQWPLERYAALMERIWDTYRIKAVICGAPGEEALGRRLRELVPEPVQAVYLTGATTLAGFAAVIKGSELVLANESSAIHLAAAVGTRSVCLTGGGHYGRFVPYCLESSGPLPVVLEHRMACFNCNWDCIYPCRDAAAPCLAGITVDEVWGAVRNLLDRS